MNNFTKPIKMNISVYASATSIVEISLPIAFDYGICYNICKETSYSLIFGEYQKRMAYSTNQKKDKLMTLDISKCKLTINGKSNTDKWTIEQFSKLLETAEKNAFYIASNQLLPHMANCPNEAIIKFVAPYGTYSCKWNELKETMSSVILSKNENKSHYEAIDKAETILSTLKAFTLDGKKPKSKKGKPPAVRTVEF